MVPAVSSQHGPRRVNVLLSCSMRSLGRVQMALGRLMGHEEAWPFVEPVSATDVPDYYTIIKACLHIGMAQPAAA